MPLLTDPCLRADTLSAAQCAQLIGLFDRAEDSASARLSGGIESDIRVCRSLWLDDLPETSWLFQRLAVLIAEVNREFYQFDLVDFRESVQILRYDASTADTVAGRYDTHIDIGASGGTASRKLSVSIQLSQPGSYTGGGLLIGEAGEALPATRALGAAILFPSFVRHSVAPLASGTRYALVAWVHGPAFR